VFPTRYPTYKQLLLQKAPHVFNPLLDLAPLSLVGPDKLLFMLARNFFGVLCMG
jgi:hypothetical protein